MAGGKLAFVKLIVRDLVPAQAFYERAFGFEMSDQFDTPEFREAILRQPGEGFALILLAYKDGRPFPPPEDHGPLGFVTDDLDALHADLLAAGASARGPVITIDGGMKVAFLSDLDGHEIELCQFR